MRAGMQPLLDVLRGDAALDLRSLEDWETLLELAEEQHVLPWIVKLLRARDVAQLETFLPAAIDPNFHQAERDSLVAAFLQTSELKELLQKLAGAGVAVIPLKGPSLAERIYDGVADRTCRDLDLLVRKEEFRVTSALLQDLDYVPESVPDDYHQSWRRGASVVELHFDIENPLAINFQVETVWQRARPDSFNGAPCWRLAPSDELLLLCIHGVRHRFEYLGLVLDIVLAVRALAPEIGPAYRIEDRNQDARIALLLGMAMARKLDPTIASLLSIPIADETATHAETIAVRLWEELLCVEPIPLDWQRQHGFFIQLERSRWRRARRRAMHLRILASRLIGPDLDFAAAYGLHRSWQARVLRPIRLALSRARRE